MGNSGKEIPVETQFLVVEVCNGSNVAGNKEEGAAVYTVFLPILEGDFRAVLQGNENNELEICLESGKTFLLGRGFHTFIKNVWFYSPTDVGSHNPPSFVVQRPC